MTDASELREAEERAREVQEQARFLQALDARGPGAATAPGEGGWSAPIEGALPAHDLALMAGRRLKDVSVYLLFFAYTLLLLALALGAVLWLWGGLPGVWGIFAFLASGFVGVLTFISFKFMSDSVRAIADLSELARSIDTRMGLLSHELERLGQGGAAQGDPTR